MSQDQRPLVLRFAIAGFVAGFSVSIALCVYAFFLSRIQQIGNDMLFLVLCPPSIASMALDNASTLGGIIGWLFISLANAGIYALLGTLVGLTKIFQQGKSHK